MFLGMRTSSLEAVLRSEKKALKSDALQSFNFAQNDIPKLTKSTFSSNFVQIYQRQKMFFLIVIIYCLPEFYSRFT